MVKKTRVFVSVAKNLLIEIFQALRAQALTRTYLLALAIFFLAVLFSFLALNPVLYSFVYPLF